MSLKLSSIKLMTDKNLNLSANSPQIASKIYY